MRAEAPAIRQMLTLMPSTFLRAPGMGRCATRMKSMDVRTAQGRQHSRRESFARTSSRRPAPAQLAMSIRALIASGIVFGLVLLWASASTGYILFRDEFLAGMVHRQTQM